VVNIKYLANKAPMGWNSYDYYDTTVDESQVMANADYMARHLREYGWEYVVVDIQWYARDAGSMRSRYQYVPFGDHDMDEHGRLVPDVSRFPSSAGNAGFKVLADYVHNLGLKFGIHIMRGIPRAAAHGHLPIYGTDVTADMVADPSSICGWNPDMYGIRKGVKGAQEYYDSIIGMYAGWGVDYIKCDDICNTNMYRHNQYSAEHEVEMLHHATAKCGREMILSLSPGPALIEKAWHYEKYANMWRITDDFWDRWDLLRNMFDRCELWQNHVGRGSYPDCDMLPLGKLGHGFGAERDTNLTRDEQVTMMTLWCVFGSPLVVGANLTKLDDWTLSLLTNKDVLRLLSNDYVGMQVAKDWSHAIWSKANGKTGERYVALFNFMDTTLKIECDMDEVEQFVDMERDMDEVEQFAEMERDVKAAKELRDVKAVKEQWDGKAARELWDGSTIYLRGSVLTGSVPSHGARLYQLC